MNVLMSGGTGLIGRKLTDSLLADGHDVTILTRNPEKASSMPSAVNFVQWDATTTDGWAGEMEKADVVVHLAGESLAEGRWTADRKARIRDSRVLSGQALTAAVEQAQNRPSAFIQASAVGYYGPRGDEVITESAAPGSDFLAHVCFVWEAATAPVEKLGLRRAVARIGIVLSTEGVALKRLLLPFKLYVGGKLGSGKQWWPWIHVDDEIRALRFLIDNESAAGAFNLTAPNPVRNDEFASTLGKVMGRPSLFPVPGPAITALYGEMATVVLDGQRAIPQHLEEMDFAFEYPQLEEALTELLA
jgi:uncharacterized protein (TIGR01777 family)